MVAQKPAQGRSRVVLPSESLSSDFPTSVSVFFLAHCRRRAVRRSAKVWSPVECVQVRETKSTLWDRFVLVPPFHFSVSTCCL